MDYFLDIRNWTPIFQLGAIIALWFGMTSLLRKISGWDTLFQKYPSLTKNESGGERAYTASGYIGPVAFNNSLKIKVGAMGINLSGHRLIQPFQKPIYIPWKEIPLIKHETKYLTKRLVITPNNTRVSIALVGKTKEHVEEIAKSIGVKIY